MVVWWVAMGTLLPMNQASEGFANIVSHPFWIPVNVIGFVACIAWSLSVVILNRKGNELGFILSFVGTIMFAAIQFYETFIWPIIATYNPELLTIKGAMVMGDLRLLVPFVLSGIFILIGYTITGIQLIKRGFVKWKVIIYFLGAILFANGLIVLIRTLGIFMFAVGLVLFDLKDNETNSKTIRN